MTNALLLIVTIISAFVNVDSDTYIVRCIALLTAVGASVARVMLMYGVL